MSIRNKSAKSILYNATAGTLVTTGTLDVKTWYRIKARAATGSALPDFDDLAIFKTPALLTDQITLAVGDEVWPLTLEEVCKSDISMSGECPVIEVTDSCDYPATANIPDGFTNFSGTINTMLRFDDDTNELVSVAQEFLNRFYDIYEDDSEGTYALTAKDDSDLLMMILLNSDTLDSVGMVETYEIMPIILNSLTEDKALKDVMKADYGWTKGQGPAQLYMRTVSES